MPKRTETITRSLTVDDGPCPLCLNAYPGEVLHTCKEHIHFHAQELKDDAANAYKASLSMLFAHVADIHMVIMKIISRQYGHSVDDMLRIVLNDPDWTNIYLHPTLKRMVYFDVDRAEIPQTIPGLESDEEEQPPSTPVRIKRKKTEEPKEKELLTIKRPKTKKSKE
jgi:hypothetical protein